MFVREHVELYQNHLGCETFETLLLQGRSHAYSTDEKNHEYLFSQYHLRVDSFPLGFSTWHGDLQLLRKPPNYVIL